MSRVSRRVAIALAAIAVVVATAPSAWAAKTIPIGDYAASICAAEAPFFNSIAAATTALQATSSSNDPTTVRKALDTFTDSASDATGDFRKALSKLGTPKSSSVQSSTIAVIARLKKVEKVLSTTKRHVSRLNVADVNGFGIGLALVQKDLVAVSNGLQSIGKIKNPKELDEAVANDPVCQQVITDAASKASGG